MKLSKIAIPVVLALSLAACQSAGPKQTGGTLIGAAAGGLIGSQFGGGGGKIAATLLGVAAGAWLGSEMGKSMDNADRAYANRTAQQSLESAPAGQSSTWQNPDSGHYGTVTPTKTYQTGAGQYCREYQQTVTIGGKTEEAYGTACRQPDGSWQIVRN